MAIEIKKIVNTTTKKSVENKGYTVQKDEQDNTFTVSSENVIETVNLEFTLEDATHEYVIGKGKLSTDNKSITNLTIIKKTKLNFEGTLEIKNPKKQTDGKVAKINVKIGNMNPDNDWIIDMSNKVNDQPSSLDVTSLIEWIKDKGAEAELTLPPAKDAEAETQQLKKIEGLIIEFNSFKFNLSKKDYNISFQTKEETSLTFFDKFELSNIKFTLTNMDIIKEPKAQLSSPAAK